MSDHLDLDALADALAGEPSPHLSSCGDCTARLAELAAAEAPVIAALAALPDPPLPPGLADRLTAALAAEPPLRPAGSGSATVTPLVRPRRPWVPAAAAALVLVLAGGLGYALVGGGTGGSDTATTAADTAAGQAAPADVQQTSSGTDYSDTAAVTGVLPSVLDGSAGSTAAAMSAPLAASEPSLRAESGQSTAAGAADAADPLARLRDPAALAACLLSLLPPDEPEVQPLAVDFAAYAGQPALAVVLPDPDPAKLQVFVVGPQCSQADDATLHFVRVDRP